jgi:peptide/nickel transport system substrate-binding protein
MIPGSWAADPARRKFTRDLNMAKQKLAEAGTPGGFTLEMMVFNDFFSQLAQVYQAQLAEAGIQLEITKLEVGTYSSRLAASDFTSLTQNYPEKGDPHEALVTFAHSKGRWHKGGWTSAEYEALVDKGGSTFDQPQRKLAYSQAEAIVEKELPLMQVVYEPEIKVMRKNVKDFVHVPDTILHLKTVWLDA